MALRGNVNLTDALISATQTSAVVRTGTIVQSGAQSALVNVGGSTFSASFLDWYNPPVTGDLVAVVRQDSTWLILGPLGGAAYGAGVNQVANSSFEDTAPGTAPGSWTLRSLAGTGTPVSGSSATVRADPYAPDASQVVELANTTTNNAAVALVSAPIPVLPGQTYRVSAYASNYGFYPAGTNYWPAHDAQLYAGWFLSAATTFPDQFATIPDKFTLIDQAVDVRESPPYSFLNGAVTVPGNANITVMRIVLAGIMSNAANAGTLRFDSVTCGRLS